MKKCLHFRLLALMLAAVMVLGLVGNVALQTSAAAPASYTDILEGQTKNVTISSSGGAVYFRFIPAYSGTYTFSSSDSGDPVGALLNSSGTQLTGDDDSGPGNRDFRFTYSCTAGTTYYLKASTYSNNAGSYTVTISGSERVLTVGQSQSVSITAGGGYVDFRFVPTTTASYTFTSISSSGDPHGYLLNSSKSQLVSNDDDGDGLNFQITYNCTAGTTYYLRAAMHSLSATGTYTVSVTQTGASSGTGTSITTALGTTAYTLFNSGCTTSSGRYYTDSSNPAPSTLTNNGYDIYASASRLPRTRIGRSIVIAHAVTELSYLTIKAYDVDESEGERDLIYLVDATTGTKTQLSDYLSGRDEEWNDTTFRIDPSMFTVGHEYYFELYESVSGWVVWVRNVDLQLGMGSSSSITSYDFDAEISASGQVTANLSLTTTANTTYALEYAAVSEGDQYGSLLNQSITATPSGASKTVTFQLESGAPEGNYQIEVTLRDASGQVVATYSTTTSGPNNSTVTYNANGGSNNLPMDQNVYRSGDTVTVLFDYVPSKTDFVFLGWARTSTATQAEFTANGTKTFTIGSDDVTLYAVWRGNVEIETGTIEYNLFNSGRTTPSGWDAYIKEYNPAPHTYDNNGYDLHGWIRSATERRFRLGQSFTVQTAVTESALLNIMAWDVDEDIRDCSYGFEYDYIDLIDETTGESVRLDGHLSGQNNTWNTTTFHIDPSLLEFGHTYHFELYMTCTGNHSCSYYEVIVRTVSLLVNGLGAEKLEYADLSVEDSSTGLISVALNAKAYQDGIYTLEYKAVHAETGSQKGGKMYSVTIPQQDATFETSFQLESGFQSGPYTITLFIKDESGNVVVTREVTINVGGVAVSYNANGGSQNLPQDLTDYVSGNTVTVLFDYIPSKPGYVFLGWARSRNAVQPEFTANGTKTFTIGSDDVTLYAVWGNPTGTTTITLFDNGLSGEEFWNHDGNPAPDTMTNGGYDIWVVWDSARRVRMGLSFTITSPVVGVSTVTIKATAVDEDQGERALVYLVDATTGTKTQLSGWLSGPESRWVDNEFQINPSLFTVGHEYYFEVYESVDGWGALIRKVELELATNTAPTVTVEAPTDPVILDQTFEVYFVVSDSDPLKSAAFVPDFDQSIFELVSVQWLETADLQLVTPEIASAWSTATDVNGRLVRLVFRAKALTSGSEITTDARYSVGSTILSFNVVGATVEVIECPHANYTITSVDDATHLNTCTVCGHNFTSAHTFDHSCDTDCNECEYTRQITHTLDALSNDNTNHWHECTVCGEILNQEAHSYDNTCDTTCNVCGYEREITHTPAASWEHDDAEHWQECSVCGETIGRHAHEYDNAADSICDTCGYSRVIRGDVDGDGDVDSDDAIRVLLYTYFASQYPLNQDGDFDGDDDVDSDDSIRILLFTYFPSQYPLL